MDDVRLGGDLIAIYLFLAFLYSVCIILVRKSLYSTHVYYKIFRLLFDFLQLQILDLPLYQGCMSILVN